MNDDQFLNYVELHSQTPRHAFHVDEINRLALLAGICNSHKYADISQDGRLVNYWRLDHASAMPLVKMARERRGR